jgi:hypothetical protein
MKAPSSLMTSRSCANELPGAAAVRLVSQLGRPLVIRQGTGSLLRARPGPGGTAEVGGEVVLDQVRDHPV